MYFALEGADCCGKSAITKLLSNSIGKGFIFTREPFTFSGGALNLQYPLQRLFKFAEDQVIHYEEVVKPALRQGYHVISDRVACVSSVVYREFDGIDPEFAYAVHNKIPTPDVVFIIDVPAPVLCARGVKKGEERYNLSRATMLRELYLEYSGIHRADFPIFVIDGDRPMSIVADDVQQRILHMIRNTNEMQEIKDEGCF